MTTAVTITTTFAITITASASIIMVSSYHYYCYDSDHFDCLILLLFLDSLPEVRCPVSSLDPSGAAELKWAAWRWLRVCGSGFRASGSFAMYAGVYGLRFRVSGWGLGFNVWDL